ncbi:MAG: hypothetical protein ACOCW0_01140 [Halanaerobium sp.]
MKKVIVLLMIILVLFSFNIYAQEEETLNTENTSLEDLDLSAEKSFSQSAREELLGIASQFDSEDDQSLAELNFTNDEFTLTETTLDNSRHLNLLNDLNFDANYSQQEDKRLETAADFQLEYALNSRTSIRAGYSLLNEEWWDWQRISTQPEETETDDNHQNAEDPAAEEESSDSTSNNVSRVYQNEMDSSSSLGVAYRSSDRVTLSADFIDNNEFGNYYNEDRDISGNSTVLGLEYNYPEGSSIRARYQIDNAEDMTQRITGVDFDFNSLATFSASYKLLDPTQLENTLNQQKTAWDLGLGLNLNEDYGVALGYELIETENQEEEERKISASFEINF